MHCFTCSCLIGLDDERYAFFKVMFKYISCISSVVSFKIKLDCYLKNIVDLAS